AVDLSLGDESLLDSIEQGVVFCTAIQAYARLNSQRSGFCLGAHNLMTGVQVGHRTAVAHNVSLETPLIPQNIGKECVARTARLAVGTVISTHYCLDAGVYQRLEGRQIGFMKIFRRSDGIELVAKALWSA